MISCLVRSRKKMQSKREGSGMQRESGGGSITVG